MDPSLPIITDFLIVGQGLAGSAVAVELINRNKSFHIIDDGLLSSASAIASGLVNPITGKRYVKSWMVDDLLPFGYDWYTSFSELISQNLIRRLPIHRSLKTATNENDWLGRMDWPGWGKYMGWTDHMDFRGLSERSKSTGLIKEAFILDIPLYLSEVQRQCKLKSTYILEHFENTSLTYSNGLWQLGGNNYKDVILCQGAQVVDDPYFGHLPFAPAKGECLVIESTSLPIDYVSITDITIVPMGDSQFWVGSTYAWDFADDHPSRTKYENLIERLDFTIMDAYTVLYHSAAVRPSSDDRRPMLGEHSEYLNLFIFNGLGTKGTSLAPYFAHHLLEHICHQSALLPEVDIKRWAKVK